MTQQTFDQFALSNPLKRAIADEGYETPTPVQSRAIPHAIDGRDVLGLAQTGTGKTAAFSLPLLHRLSQSKGKDRKALRALILTPTRELAVQVQDSLKAYGKYLKLRSALVMGGVPDAPQIKALKRFPEILVATPGRLLDLHERGELRLDAIQVLVLDEADRMLDMGFLPDVRKIVKLTPKTRQTLFFSATMSPNIKELADAMLRDPITVEVARENSVADDITQQVLFVSRRRKMRLLEHIIEDRGVKRGLVFSRTKRGASRIASQLKEAGIKAEAIHSNKAQNQRQRTLNRFAAGKTQVLVGTNVVARGIDVDDVTHVINFDLPDDPESYVHRIGRTARAGAAGMAYSFCAEDEGDKLRAIEKIIDASIPVDTEHKYHSEEAMKAFNEGTIFKSAKKGGGRGSRKFRTPGEKPKAPKESEASRQRRQGSKRKLTVKVKNN